ncbi:MAG: peptidase M14 [bacterium]|nr:peptidase M14 [bacterium]
MASVMIAALVHLHAAPSGPVIDCDYPGGNVVSERMEGDTVYLHQDLRDTEGWWFYWNFRVRGAAGRTLTFHFTNRNVMGTRGPAVSVDDGHTWTWLGMDAVEAVEKGVTFTYAFAADADAVRFAFAIPYLEEDWRGFAAGLSGNPNVAVETLAATGKGRAVERVRVGKLDGDPEYRVLLTCRHHACESMASYTLEGMLTTILADTDDGAWFRDHVEVLAVPFMDKDGVEDGDQGKNRKPHDHNRDYAGDSIYASTAALRAFVPGWSDGKLRVGLDLHCPYIRGGRNETVYLVGSRNEAIWAEQMRFGAILEDVVSDSLPYAAADNLPFGKEWNTSENYAAGKSSSAWMGEQEGVRLASTIEIAYANAGGATVTPDRARAFGVDLATALRRYLAD